MILNKEKVVQNFGLDEASYQKLLLDTIGQVEDFERRLNTLLSASCDYEEIAKGAHFIKGSSSMLGMEEIAQFALELEEAAEGKQNVSVLKAKAAELNRALKEVKKLVSKS